uniref:Uncharacterized protein n=1 Tax=Anguilla anguilla TaxID=7936 RepID=A0A0E9R7A4_ANGAN
MQEKEPKCTLFYKFRYSKVLFLLFKIF